VVSDDIVTRLRGEYASCECSGTGADCDRCEVEDQAADEIERLRAEVDSEDGKAYRTLRVMYDNRGREIERLRAERDKWRSIANQLVNGAERQIDDLRETLAKVDGASGKTTPSNVYWVAAWRRHDEAVRDD